MENIIEGAPKNIIKEERLITKQIKDVEEKIAKWIKSFEELEQLDSVAERIRVLETEKKKLQSKLEILTTSASKTDAQNITASALDFISNFEVKFEKASLAGKKEIIQKIIEKIVVDKKEKSVDFIVRRIPLVNEKVENLYKKERVLTEVVSTHGSGGRT